MTSDERAVHCRITWRRDWTPCLFSFRTERPAGIDFVPGQFVRLGVAAADGAVVWRAYSIVSRPAADHLEFYSIVVPDGPFSQPLARLGAGDTVRVDPTVHGLLHADRFEGGRHLWLLATGTGIAPFVGMLDDAAIRSRYDDIVLVHSVRRREELAYRDTVSSLMRAASSHRARLHYLPTLTSTEVEGPSDIAHGRITTLLEDGRLERLTGLTLTCDASRLMICCNPSMIREVRGLLGRRGMTPVRRDKPGQFISETFWS